MVTPIPLSAALQVAKRIGIFCAIVAVVLGIPLARRFDGRLLDATWSETWLLRILPGTLMIAFPFSMVIAIDAVRRDLSISTRHQRWRCGETPTAPRRWSPAANTLGRMRFGGCWSIARSPA